MTAETAVPAVSAAITTKTRISVGNARLTARPLAQECYPRPHPRQSLTRNPAIVVPAASSAATTSARRSTTWGADSSGTPAKASNTSRKPAHPSDPLAHERAPTMLDMWLKAAVEVEALRAQLAYLEETRRQAEADADYWYFKPTTATSVRRKPTTATSLRRKPAPQQRLEGMRSSPNEGRSPN